MDDSCAVCAETLEWVSYGPCGHRDVCSTCVARLRFICDDRRCCICKTECNVVFVTKALGDYTRMVNDFSILPTESREGQVGMYWYHEDTQAFFDDVDHYKMIKAMCRLSCSVCDQMEEQSNDGSKRRQKFRNIDQLKGHLFHRHKLFMCSLCLEGRKKEENSEGNVAYDEIDDSAGMICFGGLSRIKSCRSHPTDLSVFICEQKLYNRAQLNQHINTGDSEVDGNEAERGGFMGHPMCDFCRSPFYGDNELYSHMSTEHYTCHICQRQNPGQFEYYKNYDDLERHNAIEHGGRMSRSKRNAALQAYTRSTLFISLAFRSHIYQQVFAIEEVLNKINAVEEEGHLIVIPLLINSPWPFKLVWRQLMQMTHIMIHPHHHHPALRQFLIIMIAIP
ncbi:E3 ubiquitin-protein ligase hel2 [Vitis vinifera]|uniref:E3 ubiquitin-protein ligase hel2 n=1 Tax=Vitis vinifera TaxID=29760 RepID=A0A438IXJ7_VITVI|nr:E3 ubiquitin-protein ligase hel2 [Vitis vinifera]